MLAKGDKFPDFTLPDQNGKSVSLADLAGHWAVIYVYPKDDTPGCTIEGKSFTALKPEFAAINAVVYGLSADDVASHKAFCDKFDFTISLLADTETSLLKAAGVGQSEYKGTAYWDRTTFLIDPKGVISKVYEKVDPNGHDQAVLADIKARQTATT
ncbi:MAG: peroxiredoxin [Candidatus Sericytochromatia bacterium]|nr:peroxiredoxin [Candidatus Sericytochromatia bacterium]